jgi:hypothetical protein
MGAINIQEKLNLFSDHWSPKKVGELNGQKIIRSVHVFEESL